MQYNDALKSIFNELKDWEDLGSMADYIPELAKVNPNKFGIYLSCINGESFTYGDTQEKFSLQSVAKVFSLSLAYSIEGARLWDRVGVEPSGNSFNSLWQLEYENGIPRNPFINSGALVVCDVLCSILDNPKADFLQFVRKIAGNPNLNFNPAVAKSEQETGHRNHALVDFMKSYGNIENPTEKVLDFYFNLCSLEMTCEALAKSFLIFANGGKTVEDNLQLLSSVRIKRVNAIMQTCGFYDEAGEFAFRVGLPGKSGVGGGIAAIHPGHYAVAVWSPRLNDKGNSSKGMKALEMLTTKLELSIF